MKTKLKQNIIALKQGAVLLKELSDEAFVTSEQTVFESTIGGHFRHNLDHYNCFLKGIKNGHVDYSERERNRLIEENRSYALAEINQIQLGLTGLLQTEGYPHICIECNVGHGLAISSIQRELEFLLSHTIHHYAIIVIMCRLQGVNIDDEFGVDPSTLDYRAELNQKCVH